MHLNTDMNTDSQNFAFLAEHNAIFLQLASSAERNFSADPNTTLVKVRQLGEALAQDIATRAGMAFDDRTTQIELLKQLSHESIISPETAEAFHLLRKLGNAATHKFQTHHREALDGLKLARNLCIWYHQSFGKNAKNFRPAPFAPLKDPSQELQKLQEQIKTLEQSLSLANAQQKNHEELKQLARLQEQEKAEYEALALMLDEETQALKAQNEAQEATLKQQKADFEARILALQAELKQSEANQATAPKRRRIALAEFTPSEEVTRLLIDKALQDAGWLADSQKMTYASGERPEKGKNKAIAEWQIGREKADYVLFIGLMPVAVVEAKKQNINVSGKIAQAQRYALSFGLDETMTGAWQYKNNQQKDSPWTSDEGTFSIPFVYSTNGRPYVAQLAEQSGTWFRDVRSPSHLKKALTTFHSPENLLERLTQNPTAPLVNEPMHRLGLRDYQEKAIHAIETALNDGKQSILVAMATGTGKTRTIIGLIYRLLKANRFQRILFLVDRTSLGDQALASMKEMPLEQNLPLSAIYNINELGDMAINAETRVQVATVQAMTRRIFDADGTSIGVGDFDCIIVDEAHRGYTLDSEMTEGEMYTRDASFYLSSYRRVLDYFDAVKIGLTATPAKHTVDIFGYPVYLYSYTEAVADDWLIDFEPPICFETALTQNGIHLPKGDTVSIINTHTGQIDSATLDDELDFDVANFNRRVITEGFNRVICQALAQEILPDSEEKTLIFCATDRHADMVKRLLDEAFSELYGTDYHEEAVRKITGQSDQADKLISRFKNERYPSIAITVDLLTTGIDVPQICNLVFLRRVKSRILFEQMKGRATRRCDEIGKTVFRIFDPVGLCENLADVDTMKPLVKDPSIPLEVLIDELLHLPEPTSVSDDKHAALATHQDELINHISQSLMRVLRRAVKKGETDADVKARLNTLQQKWGVTPAKLHEHIKDPNTAKAFFTQHRTLTEDLTQLKAQVGTDRMPIIYTGEDELIGRSQVFGDGSPTVDDYLENFERFIKTQMNESVALSVVATKPKNLTREILKDIKLTLDQNGYNEAALQSAWRTKTNQDIAASIVGHIRRVALGEPLVPFETRVNNALAKILSAHAWTPVQTKALERIAKQLKFEAVIDRKFIKERFADKGGDVLIDKQLGNRLDEVIELFNEYLWAG